QRDRDYVVHEEKVEIIDPLTGRRVPDRSWQQGLHQLIELKAGVALTAENEILAKLSYQRFFRRYLRLAGMTGTATEVARELQSVYGLATVVVPTRKRVLRTVQPQRCFKSASQKWDYVVARVREAQRSGQPVLVGTDSVESSELLSDRLRDEGLKHQLLNARQDSHEAEIVAHAGQPAIVTVATSMAGRGTDIPLGAGVSQVGGLRVIATEGAASRRVDRQLMGRCGRQGDPGSFEMVISLEDERLARGLPLWLHGLRNVFYCVCSMPKKCTEPAYGAASCSSKRHAKP
ncbi:MAG: translocase, partial [Deltaproteobacteria bacterium]|nr:translocase [Deltaproteobacteria bacterium]